MNLPNKLTLLRVILIPIFIVFFILGCSYNYDYTYINIYRLIAAIIFVIASITDYFDGKIARKYNLITNFGKLMDPLADKMLVITALFLLSINNEINYICTLIVILRELIISSIRLIALEKGQVIAASKLGKYKTATQMVSIVLILFNIYKFNNYLCIITYGLFYISMFFVIVSLIDYILKNKSVFE